MADASKSGPRSGNVSRRTFLRAAGVTGAVALGPAVLRGRAEAQETPSPIRPDPAARRGGTLRYAVHNAPAHFDVHQSGTVANIGPQSPMYDCLIRRDPRDGQTIIPDLAWKWDISPDGKKYTFYLRKGVKFHDGADFTAEDVKATYDRIVRAPKGVVIPRSSLFTTVGEIVVLDPHRIEFRMTEPRPRAFMLGAFASGWNIIVRKKTLEDHQGNLRQVMDFPGTGPYKHVSRKDKEIWIMDKNPNYWNKGLPYLDRLEIYHLPPWSPDVAAALLGGKIDYARTVDPVAAKKIQTMPNLRFVDFYQSVIHALWVNNTKKPLNDPRVRRAMHLALDRHVLVDVVKDVTPTLVGGFTYPFSEFAASTEEQGKLLGYQRDATASIKEARRLLAAAGYDKGIKGLDFMVRELAHHKLWSVALQAMLKENLNIETNMRTVQTSVWFDEAQSGNFDVTISAIVSTLLDPSDYFNSWYITNGPQNYSKWHNEPFDKLVDQIDHELDPARRKALIRQAEAIMEQDPPVLPVAWEKMNDAYYTYVKGHLPTSNYFGIYDVVRWDTAWLDKS